MLIPLMFEKKHQDVIPRHQFLLRLLKSLGLATIVILVALGLGIFGYHYLAGLGWVDALLNASMILAGMGPSNSLDTTTGKLFASAYALFSAAVYVMASTLLLIPIVHRILHHFHHKKEENPRN